MSQGENKFIDRTEIIEKAVGYLLSAGHFGNFGDRDFIRSESESHALVTIAFKQCLEVTKKKELKKK